LFKISQIKANFSTKMPFFSLNGHFCASILSHFMQKKFFLPALILTFFAFFILACGESAEESIARNAKAASNSATTTAPDGMAVFRKNCVTCHGTDGTLGLNGAKDLTQSEMVKEDRIHIITNGKKLMTPFGSILSADEIKAVAEYTLTLKK
jgi:mono/diheme cytochrome c family protein